MNRNFIRDTEWLNLCVAGDIFMEFVTLRNEKIIEKQKKANGQAEEKPEEAPVAKGEFGEQEAAQEGKQKGEQKAEIQES